MNGLKLAIKKIFKLAHKANIILVFDLSKNPLADAKSRVESVKRRIFVWFPSLLIDCSLATRRKNNNYVVANTLTVIKVNNITNKEVRDIMAYDCDTLKRTYWYLGSDLEGNSLP